MKDKREGDSPHDPLGADGRSISGQPVWGSSRAARRIQIIAAVFAVLLMTGFTGWLAWSTFSHHSTVRVLPDGEETTANSRAGGEGVGRRARRAPHYGWHDVQHPARLRVNVVKLPWHRPPFSMIAGLPDARVSMATASYPWVHDPANPGRMTMNAASLPWRRAVDVASMSASGGALDMAALPWHQFASHPHPAVLATADVAFPPVTDFAAYRAVRTAAHPVPQYMARAIVPALVVMDEEDGKALAYVEPAEVPWQRSLDESMLLDLAQASLPWDRGVPMPAHWAMAKNGRAVQPVYVALAWLGDEPPAGEQEAQLTIDALAKARAAAEEKAAEQAKAQEATGQLILKQQDQRRKEQADARRRQKASWKWQLDRVTKGRIERGAALQLAKNRVKRLMDAEKASLSVMTAVKTQKEAAPTWPGFVMSMARGADGVVWIGSEDEGVFRYDPATERLTQFTTQDGMGDDNGYAVAVDHQGRVWAGHLNHGVSVFDGQRWQCYEVVGGLSRPDTLSGPLGERIFDIAVCPTDGDVWIATSAGLSRYSPSHDDWSYYTRGMNLVHGEITVGSGGEEVGGRQKAEGSEGNGRRATDHGQLTTNSLFIPADQVQAIAFDAEGNIYCATQCDGMAMADAGDGYNHWRTVRGPERMPTEPAGKGLPTSLMNDVMVARDGTVYAATTTGLAWSTDKGKTWHYVRGADYADKVRGLYGGPPTGWTEKKPCDLSLAAGNRPRATSLLPEDYITCLAEGADGLIWLGYRQQGYEALDSTTGRQYPVTSSDEQYVTALLPGAARDFPAVGTYGDGHAAPGATALAVNVGTSEAPKLPSGAAPLTEVQLSKMAEQLKAIPISTTANAVYLAPDWSTWGDWMGRYGRQKAVLCAANSPLDHVVAFGEPYFIVGDIGPHHTPDDGLRHWIHRSLQTDNPKSLWNPYVGYRRQAEWDDHGEAYTQTFEGPDLWIKVGLPQGTYGVSLYFFNKDGHLGTSRYRDYWVELLPYAKDIARVMEASPIARCRIRDFWGGEYQRFIINGPSEHYLRIRKNGSLNTICSGVFIDKLAGPVTVEDKMPRPMMGNLRYDAPAAPAVASMPTELQSVATIWNEVGRWRMNGTISAMRTEGFILVYRAAMAKRAPAQLLDNWRWEIPLWSPQDRQMHSLTMAAAWEGMKKMNPHLADVVAAEQTSGNRTGLKEN